MGLSALAQSHDGWFTGRLLVCHLPSHDCTGAQYSHLFNIENHHSFGMGVGVFWGMTRPSIPVTATYRLRPLGHRNWMPAITLDAGWVAGKSPLVGPHQKGTCTLRLGLETGHLRRIRYAMDMGCQYLGNKAGAVISAGIIF